MSITKKERPKSRKQSHVYDEFDEQTPWPENPDGYMVPRKQLEKFIGKQTLLKAQITAKRFMVVADAARAIGKGENIELSWGLIRRTADLDKSEDYQQIMKAMIEAIKQGEKGIMAVYCTTRYLLEYGFEYTACCNREKLYEESLKRMMRKTSDSK